MVEIEHRERRLIVRSKPYWTGHCVYVRAYVAELAKLPAVLTE